jgi:hypothetical protein
MIDDPDLRLTFLLGASERFARDAAMPLASEGLKIDVRRGPAPVRYTDKPAVGISAAGQHRLGEFLIWDSGEAEVMVVANPSGEEILTEHREITSILGLEDGLKCFLAALGIPLSRLNAHLAALEG